jgi:hypothetical protein
MESQCLIYITNFIETKNHFNHLKNIYAYFLYDVMLFFNKYLLTSRHIRLKSVVCLEFDLFGFSPTIRCENIVKILHNNDMVEVQTWDP